MHNEKIHIDSGSKPHKVLLDNTMGAGVGAAAIAQDDQRSGIGILTAEHSVPHPLDVVAAEAGCIVTRPYGHKADIPGDIVDAVWDNLAVGERPEVVVKGFRLSGAEGLPVTLEVAEESLLLGVNADYRKPQLDGFFSDVRNVFELLIPVFDIPHRKVLDERPAAKAEETKYLPYGIFGRIVSALGQFLGYPRNRQVYPSDILVLRQSGRMRGYNQLDGVNPFRMGVQKTLPATAGTAYFILGRFVLGLHLMESFVQSIFAYCRRFANFVDATSATGKNPRCEIVSPLVFVERRHKHHFLWCKHFWRGFRNHFEDCSNILQFTKFSPVLQIYLLDNQIINPIINDFFSRLKEVFFSVDLWLCRPPMKTLKLSQLIF